MDKQLMAAYWYVCNEVVRIMTTAMKDNRLSRKDWEKVNKLFELFADGIKQQEEWRNEEDG